MAFGNRCKIINRRCKIIRCKIININVKKNRCKIISRRCKIIRCNIINILVGQDFSHERCIPGTREAQG